MGTHVLKIQNDGVQLTRWPMHEFTMFLMCVEYGMASFRRRILSVEYQLLFHTN